MSKVVRKSTAGVSHNCRITLSESRDTFNKLDWPIQKPWPSSKLLKNIATFSKMFSTSSGQDESDTDCFSDSCSSSASSVKSSDSDYGEMPTRFPDVDRFYEGVSLNSFYSCVHVHFTYF